MPTSPADAARCQTAPEIVELGRNLPDEIVDGWRALAHGLDGASYFQTPDWVLGWWETVAGRPRTSLALWSSPEGELGGVVGLSRLRHRFHRGVPISVPFVTNAGTGPGDADHCGPLVRPALRAGVAAWLYEAAAGRALLLRNVDAASDAPIPPGSRLLATTTCPRLEISDARQPLARSVNFRRQLGRFERRLHHAGVAFHWIAPGRVDSAIVNTLFELHGRRRRALDRPSSLGERHRALLNALVRTATPKCGPAAVIARVDARIVGVMVGFRWKDTFSAYQSGWDTAYASSSLGSVLVHQAICLAARDGVRTFDFLRGAEPYKYRFGAVDASDRSYLLVRNLSGHALELERRLRRRIGRVSLSTASVRTDHRAGAPR